ncbi:MAG: tetratricopeptide repeat protein, partial [Lachnospiraceae bacterium]|nr:tetratricopeptide repeat protein [Lachnospiraceae bacterium]
MIVDNQEAYETLSWILDNADSGFFIVTAPYQLQNELILRYETSKTAIYDYAKSENKFTFTELGEWADTCPDDEFLFIVNMQVIFNDENAMNSINLCRDMLASKNRAWLFFMTRDCEEMLAKNARDFYSYVRMKAYFKAEIERFNLISTEKVVNYDKAGEAIERYAEIEKSLMSLAIEDTPHDELATAAVTLSNLADLYKNYNDYDKALRISEKVILIREKVFGKEHPETAIAYNFIASIYFDRGDFSEAIKWINEDLMICLKVLGKKNINTAFAYNNIASIYKYMHGYEEALVFFEKARIICEEVQGKNHEDTASIYNNIADLYSYQGDYLRALEWCEKSLEIYE